VDSPYQELTSPNVVKALELLKEIKEEISSGKKKYINKKKYII